MKVLIIKISSMGDIIHTLPALTDALHVIPNISFDWIVEKNFSEIPKWHPAISQVISINLRYWKKKWYRFSSWKEYYQCIKLLKKENYDVIIDAQGLLKTSFFITNIINNKKSGMDYISARESISAYFLNTKHYISKYQHAIKRMRQLFAYSLQYSVPCSLGEYNINYLFPRKVNNVFPYLIFFHSTTQLKKHWLEFNWSLIIQYAIAAGFYVKLPYWTYYEALRVRRLSKQCNSKHRVVILSKLTLRQIAMHISEATAVISIDTGCSHLTAALGCPNLTLYGPTDPYLIGTVGKNQNILYSKTKHMKNLTARYVWEMFEKILKM